MPCQEIRANDRSSDKLAGLYRIRNVRTVEGEGGLMFAFNLHTRQNYQLFRFISYAIHLLTRRPEFKFLEIDPTDRSSPLGMPDWNEPFHSQNILIVLNSSTRGTRVKAITKPCMTSTININKSSWINHILIINMKDHQLFHNYLWNIL